MADEDARWVSYAALAEARGTTKRAAVVLVRRHQWLRRKDNAGHVTALVPATWLERPTDDNRANSPSNGVPHGAPHDALGDAGSAIAALERTVEALRQAHAEALRRADARAQEAQERAEKAEAALAATRAGGRLRRAWRAWRRA